MRENLRELLILKIHNGKNLENLDEAYIIQKLEKYFLRNGDVRKKIEFEFEKILKKIDLKLTAFNGREKLKNNLEKNKIFKQIIKEVRSEIGQVYGQFLTSDFKKRNKILKECENYLDALKILKLHKSTRERINFYEEIYKKIFNWHKPKFIVDLACGLNPISYPIIKSQLNYSPSYFAVDLGDLDMKFLNSYFKKFEINGNCENYDISNLKILKNENLKKADLIFLFKALDSFEEIKKNISKELLEKIPAKNIVVSFPTKSLVSKRPIKINKRDWVINFIKKQNWNYESFEVENEIFFLIEK